jgi:hypothetical protein
MPALQFDRRRLRRTTCATLLVWLFALTAGVFNACALAPAGATGRLGQVWQLGAAVQDLDAGALTAAGHGTQDHHDHPAAHHGHGSDSGKVNCLQFCNDESSAIAKVPLPVTDLGLGLPTLVEPWHAIAAAGSVGFRQSPERPGSRGPPLVIRFLRLTL